MVFDSYTFIVFLTAVLAVHYSAISWQYKKLSLLISSYLFYGSWNPPFVILLVLSTTIDWFAAQWMHVAESKGKRVAFLVLSLCTNLGMLGFFKYANFLVASYTDLVAALGITHVPPKLSIILPVGISFYTFQTLSYTIDVYRRKMEPAKSPLDFALYVSFFPQLVAGPIVRAVDFLPQCSTERRVSARHLGWGACLLVLGLFLKMVIADSMFSQTVDEVYSASRETHGTLDSWLGTIAFAGQIYCDFAGYSFCAIGVAMMLGFALPDNFRCPYAAIGFSDFWRRWHISLSTWLRDYLYIPLGGNRHGQVVMLMSLMATMLLGGLWHGPSWTFVAWGAVHGALLVIERLIRQTAIAKWSAWSTIGGKLCLAAITFACVCFTWVLFRANTFQQASSMWLAMMGWGGMVGSEVAFVDMLEVLGTFACLAFAHWHFRETPIESAVDRTPPIVLSIIVAAMLVTIFLTRGESRAFIYFQF